MTLRKRHRANGLASAVRETLSSGAGGGLILIAAAVAAMLVANSPLAHGYEALFHDRLTWTPLAKLENLHLWINDALMAVFFFVVGLEIKRELVIGELANPAARRLPVVAAAAGMAVPALCYLAVAGTGTAAARGWAVPAATDIAFAMGVIALIGPRVPPSLRLFLLTVAIVDDVGAVVIIALFYTAAIKLAWLLGGLAILAAMFALNRLKVTAIAAYVLLAIALWFCILHSGVHATVAGVLAALPIPLMVDKAGRSLLLRLEHALAPWNAYLIVPLFGFANAGVALGGSGAARVADPVPLAVVCGLFVGKQLGVFAAIFASDRLGFAPRPAGASWMQLWGAAVLCGIGFTMSLFIGALAFDGSPALYEEAKLGTLLGSVLSALLGFALLRWAPSPQRRR
jgi:NhaA family Na+:H+ antiporter